MISLFNSNIFYYVTLLFNKILLVYLILVYINIICLFYLIDISLIVHWRMWILYY